MNVGLIDVDGHNYPNLALMKLSAWHKAQGDHVEWWWGWGSYDIVYMSKVFDETYSMSTCSPSARSWRFPSRNPCSCCGWTTTVRSL